MIKLIVFDLDGVLIDAKDIHYEALNKALQEITVNKSKNSLGKTYIDYSISREDHLSKYDGLNTKAKLEILTKEKGLPKDEHINIFNLKQKYTTELINEGNYKSVHWHDLMKLKNKTKCYIAVASNSIRNTVRDSLVRTKLINYVDFYLSNEDVKHPKPNTEIYLQAMVKAGVSPKETLIIEDSYIGRQGAEQTGALVMGVNSPSDITFENIKSFIDKHEGKIEKIKWKDPKLNILIPMAGAGSRFSEAGFIHPKPLIEIMGKPMIQLVTENLNIDAHFIYLVQKEHNEKYNLKAMLNIMSPGCDVVEIDGITEGAACTTLLAKKYINSDNPLLIANSDQFVEWNSGEFMYSMMGDHIDGGILTFNSIHPKWSFVKIGSDGLICEVAEKQPISDLATVGIYFWKRGSDYVKYAEEMITKNIRVNNEFYICPVYNSAIKDGKKIKSFKIDKMWGLGDPQSFNIFIDKYQEGNNKKV